MDQDREEELESLSAVFPELVIDASNHFSATLQLPVQPAQPMLVRFVPPKDDHGTYAATAAHVERDVDLSHLPPIAIRMTLPEGYPTSLPPKVELSAQLDWLPEDKIAQLEAEAANLWEEYGHCPILYSYIDHIQQTAERGFDLYPLVSPSGREAELVQFDNKTRQERFSAGTYDCDVCLERKKGAACYEMRRCGHIFCRQCLQAFYNNAIKEGDVAGVSCLDPTCGEKKSVDGKKKPKEVRTLHPRELLAIGLEESVVRRYVEMKRKKRIEADKSTVYCPRTWCQGPAKSDKYPPLPADLTAYVENEASDNSDDVDKAQTAESKVIPSDPSDRLAVCEKCQLAFCKVCYLGWHGPLARCHPRDPGSLTAEEKASYDYIRMRTSPCPYCYAPVQKTMGCNHMQCTQCRTHFCYLCGSWLCVASPYLHFNSLGTPCYQRLWELEEGDEQEAPEDDRGFAGDAQQRDEQQQDAQQQRAQQQPARQDRARQRGGHRRGPAARAGQGQVELDGREQAELQRFLEMARRDEEDGWDSDELDGDDDRFIIPIR